MKDFVLERIVKFRETLEQMSVGEFEHLMESADVAQEVIESYALLESLIFHSSNNVFKPKC